MTLSATVWHQGAGDEQQEDAPGDAIAEQAEGGDGLRVPCDHASAN